ncbi:hypothetical protein MCEZEM1_01070 [Comamonadaceae bacterium]
MQKYQHDKRNLCVGGVGGVCFVLCRMRQIFCPTSKPTYRVNQYASHKETKVFASFLVAGFMTPNTSAKVAA